MKKIVLIVIIGIVVKLFYLVFAMISGYEPDLNVFKNSDSYWYEKIALDGHEKITPDKLGKCEEGNIEQSYYAFFPLYPLILGLTIKLTGLTFNGVAFIYSGIFSLLLFVTFYRYILKITDSETIGLHSTLVLILFPFHYYFSVYYTEALFMLLLVAAFYAIERRKIFLFLIYSSLLVLVRPNGLFLLLPLFLYFMEKNYGPNILEWIKLPIKQVIPVLYFCIPVLFFVLYCSYLWIMTGDFFAYKTAQAGWCRETVFPWVPIFRSSNWMEYFSSGYLIGFMLLSLFYIKKMPLSFLSLIWISLILPLTANSITSPRFISVIFIFSMIFGELLNKNKNTINIVIYVLLFFAQLFTFHFWLIGSTFSY